MRVLILLALALLSGCAGHNYGGALLLGIFLPDPNELTAKDRLPQAIVRRRFPDAAGRGLAVLDGQGQRSRLPDRDARRRRGLRFEQPGREHRQGATELIAACLLTPELTRAAVSA